MSTILVVEDEVVVAKDIQRTLRVLGYQVPSTAHTGADALRLVEANQPDLVLMDITLRGDMDGIATTALLRARWDVPVIYLTAHSDEATLDRAKETDPHGYLIKPFNERDLRTAIEVALRKHDLEKVLSERERWFSTTLDSIGDAIIATDPEGRVTFMNPIAEHLTGWKRAEATGQTIEVVFRLLDDKGQPIEDPVRRAIRERVAVKLPPNTQLRSAVGHTVEVDDSASPIIDDRGTLLGGVVVFRDVTERQRLQERLLLSERLASIGSMAAGMAHEINNPLAAVLGNMSFASEQVERVVTLLRPLPAAETALAELAALQEAVQDATQAAEHVRRIVQDIKKFARAGETNKQVLDLPDVLDSAIKLTDNQLRHHARLLRKYSTTPFVEADEGQLVQVFANLLVNAAQAIEAGRVSDNRIDVSTRTDEAGNAVVEVRDSGCGIAKADLPRIFEPFFSTKSAGDGMGLGLSICHGIVAGLGGDLTVESEVGRGSTFRVVLPPTQRRGEAAAPVAPPAPVVRRARVLVIDDDESVGRVVVRVLGGLHDVVAETDPHAALNRVKRGENFDVIFCDLMMPNLSGVDVHAALLAAKPELARRMVFLTGGSFTPRTTQFLESVANQTVAKPFSVDGLRAIVADYVGF